MKKSILSAALLLTTSSVTFTAQAMSTTTIDLVDYSGTLIENKWQDLSGIFGPGFEVVHTSNPYSTPTTDALGTITLSPIVDFEDNSHIHVNGGSGAGSDATPFIHGDVGGVFIDGTGTHDVFSFQSMDVNVSKLQAKLLDDSIINHPNQTLTVRGYLGGTNGMVDGIIESDGMTMQYNGGTKVAETIITDGFSGVVNFLSADAGFGEVDYVEFFFTDFYRLKPSSLVADANLTFEFDNIVVGEAISAVPVPAAVWLFGSGLMGMLSIAKRKKNVMTF